jgi:hypothetical protein
VLGSVRLRDIASATPIALLEGHSGWVNGVAFSPDAATLASVGYWVNRVVFSSRRHDARQRRQRPAWFHEAAARSRGDATLDIAPQELVLRTINFGTTERSTQIAMRRTCLRSRANRAKITV